MRAFDFAVQPGRPHLDVGVNHAEVFDVPVELGLVVLQQLLLSYNLLLEAIITLQESYT